MYFTIHLIGGKNARFLPAIVVKEKTSFFATVPFSHNILHSNFIEEHRAMRYIRGLIRS